MSGIDRVKEKMKKKLSFGTFASILEEPKVKPARKIYTLTLEDNILLKQIFSKRMSLQNESSISGLMSEAIKLLYAQEFRSD